MAPSRHKRIPGIKIIQENLHKAIPRFGSNARRTSLAHRRLGTLPFRLQQPVHLLPPRKHPGTGIIVRLRIIRSVARPSQIAARHIARMPQHPLQLTGNDRISYRILPGILGIDAHNQLQPFTRDTDKSPHHIRQRPGLLLHPGQHLEAMIKVEQRQSVQLGHLVRRMSAPALAGHYHRIQRPFQPLALLCHARPHPPPVRLGKHLPACSPEVIMKLFQRNLFRFPFPHMEEKGNFKLSLFH